MDKIYIVIGSLLLVLVLMFGCTGQDKVIIMSDTVIDSNSLDFNSVVGAVPYLSDSNTLRFDPDFNYAAGTLYAPFFAGDGSGLTGLGLEGYVPYVGATADVNLGIKDLLIYEIRDLMDRRNIVVNVRVLYDEDENISISWDNRFLVDNYGDIAATWYNGLKLSQDMSANYHNVTNILDVETETVHASGNIYSDGNFFGNTIYGGMYDNNDIGISISFGTQYVYYSFNGGTCGLLNGFDCNGDVLTALYDGVYMVNHKATGMGQNNHVYHTMVFVNDVNQPNTIDHATHDAGNDTKMDGFGHIRVNAGDEVSLRIQDYSGISTGTVYNWNMVLKRIGN